jgi:hypothetical protein
MHYYYLLATYVIFICIICDFSLEKQQGRMILSFCAGIPTSPSKPVPRLRLMRNVSMHLHDERLEYNQIFLFLKAHKTSYNANHELPLESKPCNLGESLSIKLSQKNGIALASA